MGAVPLWDGMTLRRNAQATCGEEMIKLSQAIAGRAHSV